MNVAYPFSPKTASKGLAYSLPKSRASMSSPQVHYKAQRIPITPIIGMRFVVFLLINSYLLWCFFSGQLPHNCPFWGHLVRQGFYTAETLLEKWGVSSEEEFKSILSGLFVLSCVVVSSLCGCCLQTFSKEPLLC
jgi:hypothetical protein